MEPLITELDQRHRPSPQKLTAIRTVDLRKTYRSVHGDVQAVRGVDLDIAQGEFFGLLGANGAGKSTTIGMLAGLVIPTRGQALVGGIDVAAHPVSAKRKIGIVAQGNTLDRQLTVAENLEFRCRFFGIRRKEARQRADQLLDAFGLAGHARAQTYQLSGGQARRLMIARALVHRPEVLFLDEPTAGLDPRTRAELRDSLRALHAAGQTILLTTHYLDEAETLCDRVAVMDQGKILACGAVDDLKQKVGADSVITIRYEGALPDNAAALTNVAGISRIETGADWIRVFAPDTGGLLGRIMAAGVEAGIVVRDAAQLRPSLESVFLKLTGREYKE